MRSSTPWAIIVRQELWENRGGRPGLSVLTSLLVVSVDVKLYWTMLRHWSQLGPNMSTDIWADIKQHRRYLPQYWSQRDQEEGGELDWQSLTTDED